MKFRIIFNCESCDGTGEEIIIGGDIDQNGPYIVEEVLKCRECGGHGEGGMYTVTDLYENVDDVERDYPEYRAIIPLENSL